MTSPIARKRRRFTFYGWFSAVVLFYVGAGLLTIVAERWVPGLRDMTEPAYWAAANRIAVMLAPGALYGVTAFAPRGFDLSRVRRTYFLVAAPIGLAGTWLVHRAALALWDANCDGGCAGVVRDHEWLQHLWYLSLVPAVLLPLALAFVRWPRMSVLENHQRPRARAA